MPGTIIRERTAQVAHGMPTETGVAFVAGVTDRGRLNEPHKCLSMQDVVRFTGPRTATNSGFYDWAESFFARGGNMIYFSRILGPAVQSGVPYSGHATLALQDSSAATALTAYASSPGPWGNSLRLAVIAGTNAGEFKLVITNVADPSYSETSPSFVTSQDAVNYYKDHDVIRLELGVSANDPAILAATALATGIDDKASITNTEAQRALDALPRDLGPGQVSFINRTNPADWSMLLAHGKAKNRRALCDPPDGSSKAGFVTAVNQFNVLADAKYGAMFGPWVNLAALPGGAVRPVPASAPVAGTISDNDRKGISPNQPSAGDLGIINVDSLRAKFTTQDVDDLTALNFNCITIKNGDQRIYGYRTGAPKLAQPNWWQFGNSRLYMKIVALGDDILERYVFKEINDENLAHLAAELEAMLLQFWPKSLVGATPADAFYVSTGDQVNTPTTKANGEIHAAMELSMSSMGETVILDIYKRQNDGS